MDASDLLKSPAISPQHFEWLGSSPLILSKYDAELFEPLKLFVFKFALTGRMNHQSFAVAIVRFIKGNRGPSQFFIYSNTKRMQFSFHDATYQLTNSLSLPLTQGFKDFSSLRFFGLFGADFLLSACPRCLIRVVDLVFR